MTELLIIVPTRSRPEAVARVVEAWEATGAFEDGAELLFAFDADDPRCDEYVNEVGRRVVRRSVLPAWQALVPKLNGVAVAEADTYFAIGFAGDDHLPRTPGWARRYIDDLRAMGTGIIYCDDGYQHENIPTQWAMTSDIVRALRRMVPAPVQHLYCDNAIRELGKAAECLRYLPDVLIEHMHPVAGKAALDEQYERVNSPMQFRGDHRTYREWVRSGQLQRDAEIVRHLREES